jgi:hypothetical protein
LLPVPSCRDLAVVFIRELNEAVSSLPQEGKPTIKVL